jgi:adenylate cyclase
MQRRSEPFHSAVALRSRHNERFVAETLSLKEAAERVGVSPDTLRRWAREGVIPEVDGTGEWTTAAVAHARIVARLRDRGHKLEHIQRAGEQGRLAYGYIEELFGGDVPRRSLDDAAKLTELEPALIERFWTSLGLPASGLDELTDEDIQALHYVSAVLESGFPLVASCSSAGCTARRCRRSPTRRCGSSTSTCTSR